MKKMIFQDWTLKLFLRFLTGAAVIGISELPPCIAFASKDPIVNPAPPSAPAESKPLPREIILVPTLETAVAVSQHVFIGIGRRIYFVDRYLHEVPYERAAAIPQSDVKSAILEVDIEENLKPIKGVEKKTAIFFMKTSIKAQGDQPSGYAQLTNDYVGKRGIYFTNVYKEEFLEYSATGERVVLAPSVAIHRFSFARTMRNVIDNPAPVSQLDDVRRALRKNVNNN